MEITKIFITASKNKYRYPYKGLISTEDLWDLSPQALDGIFKEINAQLKKTGEESLLQTEGKGVTMLRNMIEIIKYILNDKLDEQARREQAVANAAKRQRIMEAIASKEVEALNDMSVDELRKMLDEL